MITELLKNLTRKFFIRVGLIELINYKNIEMKIINNIFLLRSPLAKYYIHYKAQ